MTTTDLVALALRLAGNERRRVAALFSLPDELRAITESMGLAMPAADDGAWLIELARAIEGAPASACVEALAAHDRAADIAAIVRDFADRHDAARIAASPSAPADGMALRAFADALG